MLTRLFQNQRCYIYKKKQMRSILKLTVLFLILTSLQSCVSKKKFMALEKLKFAADTKISELNNSLDSNKKHLNTMIADFNEMKYELLKSNATKDALIDSISGELNKLTKEVSRKELALDSKQFSFEFERISLNEKINELKSQINFKIAEFDNLKKAQASLSDNLAQITFDLNREKDEKKRSQSLIAERENKIQELNSLNEKLILEINMLKKQINDKNEIINRLENNVKLLKKEIK